jgi:hypothetical protein
MNERIFISYKRVDKEKVFALKKRVEDELGVKCWVDLEGIDSSAQFASKICKAIDCCEVVLFMHSKAHTHIDYDKDWTVRELNYAHDEGKHVVLVCLDDTPLKNIFKMVYGTQNNIDPYDPDQWNLLLRDLRKWLNITTTPANSASFVPRQYKPDYRKKLKKNWVYLGVSFVVLIGVIILTILVNINNNPQEKTGEGNEVGKVELYEESVNTVEHGENIAQNNSAQSQLNDIDYNKLQGNMNYEDRGVFLGKQIESQSQAEQPKAWSNQEQSKAESKSRQSSAKQKAEKVRYLVQFCVATRVMKEGDPDLQGIKDFRVIPVGEGYIYTVGNYSTLEEANQRRIEIAKSTHFKDAFVVAIDIEGNRVPIEYVK